MPHIQVKGMSCEHCRNAVTEAVSVVFGVKNVQVDLAAGVVQWENVSEAAVPEQAIKDAVRALGFDAP